MPGTVPTPGMTPPGGSTSKPVLRSRFLLGGGDSDLSRSFLLPRSLLRDLLRLSRLPSKNMMKNNDQSREDTWRGKNTRSVHSKHTCLPYRVPHLCLARQAEKPECTNTFKCRSLVIGVQLKALSSASRAPDRSCSSWSRRARAHCLTCWD